jgi:hypothetical protein
MEFLTGNNLELVLLFVAPGFISLKVWGLLNSTPKIRLSESIMEAIIYSSFNALVSLWLFTLLRHVNLWLAYGIVFILCPVIWPIGIYKLCKIKFFRTRLTPTAWDHYFNRGEACFILLHLKSGQMIGGLYGVSSFASSYPEKEDLYLEAVWSVDERGKFDKKLENSQGLLVNFEEISFIEFFKLNGTVTTVTEPVQTIE